MINYTMSIKVSYWYDRENTSIIFDWPTVLQHMPKTVKVKKLPPEKLDMDADRVVIEDISSTINRLLQIAQSQVKGPLISNPLHCKPDGYNKVIQTELKL